MHLDAAFDDRIEVRLDRALLHQHIARLRRAPRPPPAATAASTRPGIPANSSTRCSAATRSTIPSDPADVGAMSVIGRERNPPGAEGQAGDAIREPSLCGAFRRGGAPRRLGRMAERPDIGWRSTATSPTTSVRSSKSGSGKPSRRSRRWRLSRPTQRWRRRPTSIRRSSPITASSMLVTSRPASSSSLSVANGRLLPARPADRQEFVVALAVLLAYIHDVGMNDPTAEGRRIHAVQRGADPATPGAMDDVLARLWEAAARSSRGSAPSAPSRLSASRTTSFCGSSPRSRSLTASRRCPRLSTPTSRGLRRVLQHAVLVELEEHRARRSAPEPGRRPAGRARRERALVRGPRPRRVRLAGVARSRAPGARDRCRRRRAAGSRGGRAAPARRGAANCGRVRDLHRRRDRSGGVLAPHRPRRRPVVSPPRRQPVSAGEANVRKAVVTPNGDLRVSFHRGRFSSTRPPPRPPATATARVVADIGADVLGAFAVRRPSHRSARAGTRSRARCESSSSVRPTSRRSQSRWPRAPLATIRSLRGRIFVVADLENASPAERARYLEAIPIAAESDEAAEILDALDAHGMRVGGIDRRKSVRGRAAGTRSSRASCSSRPESPPAFVYIAVECALRIEQLGGYRRPRRSAVDPDRRHRRRAPRRAQQHGGRRRAGRGADDSRRALRPRMVPALRAGRVRGRPCSIRGS